MAVGYVAFDRC